MGVRTANVQDGNIGETLTGLAEVIHGRRDASPQESYTARLLTDVEDELLKKLAEEASEVIMACKDNDHDHIRYEAGDLVYHLLVTLERYGITLDELAGEYEGRAVIGKCDVDNNDDIVGKFMVRNIPTIVFIKGGQVVDKQVGACTKADLVKKLEKLL